MRYEVGETDLQHAAFVATKPWRTPRFGEVKMKKRRWKMEAGSAWRSLQEKRELRSPHDTEPDAVADVAGRAADALRRAAVVGEVVPVAAAQQTGRTSRGSCGVCKWARAVVRIAVPILAPLPNIA